MSDIFEETVNGEGVPLLTYKNFKYIKSRSSSNIGGEVYWQCTNRKCRSYMITEGHPGKRFIVDTDPHHNHKPNDDRMKPPSEPLVTTSKRKHDGDVEPREIQAARIESGFSSSFMPKEKRGILKSWSFTRRKIETCDSSGSNSSEDGSKIDIGGIPQSDPPFPGTYLQCTDSKDHQNHQDPEDPHARELKNSVDTLAAPENFRDEYAVAGWMYGNQLRSLDPQQRFIAEKLVADIVFKARLKLLKITSRVE